MALFPTARRYREAFERIEATISANHRAMLRAQFQAPDHTLTTGQLAKAAGYDGFRGAVIQYGLLAKRVCKALSFRPPQKNENGSPVWSFALADAPDSRSDEHWQWKMRPEVVGALKQLGWFERLLPAVKPLDGPGAEELADAAARAVQVGYFTPESLPDERTKRLREIVERRGQPGFRNKLIAAYNGRCAVTGCDAIAALEAAHIVPYCGSKSNHVSNGLLLRADFHTLFDLDLVGINPDTLTLALNGALNSTQYAEFDGKAILLPASATNAPSRDALVRRWEQFIGSHAGNW